MSQNGLGSEEQEILNFLQQRIFAPILNSAVASAPLKQGVRYTIMRMERLDAAGMTKYFWSAISGT